MLAYLKLFQGSSQDELAKNKVEEDAKRCVILAIKVPTVINFEEVLDLDALKYLKGVSNRMSLYEYRKINKYLNL